MDACLCPPTLLNLGVRVMCVVFQAEETTKTEKTSVTRHHQTETAAKSSTTQKQASFRPIHLDNIPLPSTGGKVVGECVKCVATGPKNFNKVGYSYHFYIKTYLSYFRTVKSYLPYIFLWCSCRHTAH